MAESNYVGKSTAFIIDHLGVLENDYREAARKHGFVTRSAVYKLFLVGPTVGAVAGLITGLLGPEALQTATEVGIGVGISGGVGNLFIELGKQRYGMEELRRSSPVSYVIDAKTALGKRDE